MYKIECSRCASGKGIISAFRHVRGGVCFKCGGDGYTLSRTSPEARAKAKAKRDAKRQAREQAAQSARIAHQETLAARYADDARIGPLASDYIARHGGDCCIYQALADIDAGTYAGDASRFLRNIAD